MVVVMSVTRALLKLIDPKVGFDEQDHGDDDCGFGHDVHDDDDDDDSGGGGGHDDGDDGSYKGFAQARRSLGRFL